MHNVVLFKDLSTSSEIMRKTLIEAVKTLSLVYGIRIDYNVVEVPFLDERGQFPFIKVDGKNIALKDIGAPSIIGLLDIILDSILEAQGLKTLSSRDVLFPVAV